MKADAATDSVPYGHGSVDFWQPMALIPSRDRREWSLADSQFVHLFQRRAALAADQGAAVAAGQRIAHRLLATRAIKVCLLILIGHEA